MQAVFIFLFIISFITTLILWYSIKERLKDNDYEVDFLFHHINDIPNFLKLISKEKDTQRKRAYLRIIIGFFISTIMLIISSLIAVLINN